MVSGQSGGIRRYLQMMHMVRHDADPYSTDAIFASQDHGHGEIHDGIPCGVENEFPGPGPLIDVIRDTRYDVPFLTHDGKFRKRNLFQGGKRRGKCGKILFNSCM